MKEQMFIQVTYVRFGQSYTEIYLPGNYIIILFDEIYLQVIVIVIYQTKKKWTFNGQANTCMLGRRPGYLYFIFARLLVRTPC